MISRFFINRPVFAAVISIVIVLAGLMSMRSLPIAQYPDIVPPEISVSANYPGASAQVVAETVAAPLEQQINGVEKMIYLNSTATASGALSMTVTFDIGINPDQAQINVNNRVQAALSTLPAEVQRQGVQVRKRSSSILQVATMFSTDPRYDTVYVSNYALINVIDELKRVPGVGDASLFGQKDYSMRIWLRPDKLAQFNLTPADVIAAVREQNSQFAAGQFGQEPLEKKGAFTYTVATPGRLVEPKEFAAIVLRADSDGAALRLGDVARVELGGADYSFSATANGRPAIAIGLYLQPGANALATAEAVKAKFQSLSGRFPSGIQFAIPFDTTRFVQISIEEVIRTFVEALVLVVLVVFLFLQNWRATLIPLIAVPISLIGTFAGMYLLGFSINLLTLFGMILAIGIVVDDAIVVLENVERIMRTEHKSPHDAAIQAMEEVSGPVIAIVLVLCAVFVPVGFLGGLAGQMYKQFAITIAVSVVISGIVALTLTPALCSLMLREHHGEPIAPFRWFNRAFDRITGGFTAGVSFFLRRVIVGLAVFAAVIAATVLLYNRVPGSLVPDEDQGYVFVVPFLPPAASLARTVAVTTQIDAILAKHPAVQDTTTFAGFDLLTFSSKTYAGVSFVTLKDWSQRTDPSLDARNLPGAFMGMTSGIHDALVLALNPPPISGMSTTGGFELYVQDRAGAGSLALGDAVQKLLAAAAKRPELTGLQTTSNSAVPQYRLTLDRTKAKALDVPIDAVFSTMQSTFGNYYVNDFTLMGRNYKVSLQSEAQFRETPSDMRYVFVRSTTGNMIPLDSLVTATRVVAADMVQRFNLFPAAKVQGNPAPGYASGQALTAMEAVAAETLGEGYSIAWTGSSYQERGNASTAGLAYLFGIVMVFLILAAQYERWSLPLAVITAVPFAILGALVAVWLRGLSNDVYFQVGLLTLIGLSAKNAILIVEFAVMKRAEGLSTFDAAMAAAKLRFRPIVMTSLAFILGVVPLVISTGAGSASRHSIGTGVVGGMLAATFIAIFLVPMFYEIVTKLTERREPGAKRGMAKPPPTTEP